MTDHRENGANVEPAAATNLQPQVEAAISQPITDVRSEQATEVKRSMDNLLHTNPILSELKETYDNKGLLTWEQLLRSVEDLADFVESLQFFEFPMIYSVDPKNKTLIIGDKQTYPPSLGDSYRTSREVARRVAYNDADGNRVIVIGNGEIPDTATIISDRGLISSGEYNEVNIHGRFDSDHPIWVEEGENPSSPTSYRWDYADDDIRWEAVNPQSDLASRVVLRVKLNTSKL